MQYNNYIRDWVGCDICSDWMHDGMVSSYNAFCYDVFVFAAKQVLHEQDHRVALRKREIDIKS